MDDDGSNPHFRRFEIMTLQLSFLMSRSKRAAVELLLTTETLEVVVVVVV